METAQLPPFFERNSHIYYKDGNLKIEDMDLQELAKELGTPLYVYSKKYLTESFLTFAKAFESHPTTICYAVKANSNLSLLNVFAELGSGFDTVSQGEIERALIAGGKPEKIIFSGVGKTDAEIRYALQKGIGCFNIESENELYRIDKIAGELKLKAPISFRINPDIDAQTHPDISTGLKENKFGISHTRAVFMYQEAKKCQNVVIKGIDCHIGSQITQMKPFLEAQDVLLKIVDELKQYDIHLEHIDLGGGLGIIYNNEKPIPITEYADKILEKMKGRSEKLMFEPGRFLVGNSGVFLTRTEYVKISEKKNFVVVDGAMNDLLRPAIYKVYHEIVNTKRRPDEEGKRKTFDIVGPVCESTDWFGKNRELYVEEGDIIAILSAGAYCFAMSSNYNSRPRPAEILVDGNHYTLIRQRETMEDVLRNEIVPRVNN